MHGTQLGRAVFIFYKRKIFEEKAQNPDLIDLVGLTSQIHNILIPAEA